MTLPWYNAGLRFECTMCGNCCTGEPGFVWLNDDEIGAIAAEVEMPREEFVAVYTRTGPRGRTLREKRNGDCIFYEATKGCTIYAVRPGQCRTWPFWESNVRSEAAWDAMSENCPGAGRGELIPVEEITKRLKVIRL